MKDKNIPEEAKAKKDSNLLIILWIILMIFLVGSDIALWLLGAELYIVICSVIISLLFVIPGVFIIRRFIKDISRSQTSLNTNVSTYLEDRKAKSVKRLKGKDMFEIVDNYRRQYLVTMIIVIVIATFLLTAAFILKMDDYNLNIPFYWRIIIPLIIMIISILVARKTDFTYITSLQLKKEIKSHGYDEQRVNNDFMMANYHEMFKGIMAIGQSYYVVFMQNFCRVGRIQGITSIESYSETEKTGNGRSTRYFIRMYEDDNTVSYFMCADRIASELIIKDFNMLGYEVIDKTM